MKIISIIVFLVKVVLYLPPWLFFKLSMNTKTKYELKIWSEKLRIDHGSDLKNFIWLFRNKLEYRSLLYFRLGCKKTKILQVFYPSHPVLYFTTEEKQIEKGLIIQHGHSTIIHARHIGSDCQIWQNVTIGKALPGGAKPIIGNNVKIFAGAVVVGNITLGNNVIVGANTVVTKSVPDNCTIVGNPARIISLNGQRVDKKL